MLQVSQFKKSYGQHLVLNVPHLQINSGLSIFQGQNGSGKSTFLKALAGMIPFEGDFNLKGHSYKKSSVLFRKMVNYTPAEPRYPDYLTGKDILAYYLKTKHGQWSEITQLIKDLKVEEFYLQKISSYSSGMLKKISLASAFIGKADLIALDEPLTTIDKESQEIISEEIAKSLAKGQSIFIASHHSLGEGSFIADTVFKVEHQSIEAQ